MEPQFIISDHKPVFVEYTRNQSQIEDELIEYAPSDKYFLSCIGDLIKYWNINLIVDLGAACGHTTYKIRNRFDKNSTITALGVDLHDWTDRDVQDVQDWCAQINPFTVYHDYLQADVVNNWTQVESIINSRYNTREFNRTVILSSNLWEHLEESEAVTFMRNLRSNTIGRWIVQACPATIESHENPIAALNHESVSGLFTGLSHKCAPGVEMALNFGPVGDSIVVTPGGYTVAFYDTMKMTDSTSFVASQTVLKGRMSRGDIYKKLRESTNKSFSCAGLAQTWHDYIQSTSNSQE